MKICPACRFDRCDDTADRCRQCGAELDAHEEEEEYHPSLAAAWFHYLRFAKATVELVPGRVFGIGRGPRNEYRAKVPDDELLRIHWSDDYDEATISPGREAKTPIKVDGIRLSKTRNLKGGEEVEGGGVMFTYLKRPTPMEGAIDAKRLAKSTGGPNPTQGIDAPKGPRRATNALEPNQRPPTTRTASKPARRGPQVARVRPADVAQALEATKAFGTLRVTGRQGRGWITVKGGVPQHAAFGERVGREALEAILALSPCRVHLDPGLPKRTAGPTLNVPFKAVLEFLARKKTPTARVARPTGRPLRPTGRPARPTGRPTRPMGRPARPTGRPARRRPR